MSDTAWVVGGGFASVVLCLIAFWRLITREIRSEFRAFRLEIQTVRRTRTHTGAAAPSRVRCKPSQH